MVTHSSALAWRSPWTEEPGGLQSMGSQRVGHDWATNTFTFKIQEETWDMISEGGSRMWGKMEEVEIQQSEEGMKRRKALKESMGCQEGNEIHAPKFCFYSWSCLSQELQKPSGDLSMGTMALLESEGTRHKPGKYSSTMVHRTVGQPLAWQLNPSWSLRRRPPNFPSPEGQEGAPCWRCLTAPGSRPDAQGLWTWLYALKKALG